MSLFGVKVAKQFGQNLPSFKNQAEAEAFLIAQKDERLRLLIESAKNSNTFTADFSPESLKHLEIWYFELWESDGFERLETTREEFECFMAAYFGEIAVRNNPDTKWIVSEFAFERGKYEIGIHQKLFTQMLNRFADHYKTPNNTRRQKLFKMYQQRFSK
jgi:hypothetical protein